MTSKETVICSGKGCNKTIQRHAWQLANSPNAYCSVKCQRAARLKFSRPVGKARRKGDPATNEAQLREALKLCQTATYLQRDGTPHKHRNGRVVTLRREVQS